MNGEKIEGDIAYQEIYRLANKSIYIIDDYMKSKENLKDMLENFASQNPLVDIAIITPCERYMKEFMEWFADPLNWEDLMNFGL